MAGRRGQLEWLRRSGGTFKFEDGPAGFMVEWPPVRPRNSRPRVHAGHCRARPGAGNHGLRQCAGLGPRAGDGVKIQIIRGVDFSNYITLQYSCFAPERAPSGIQLLVGTQEIAQQTKT
jgi:hypothetical protein